MSHGMVRLTLGALLGALVGLRVGGTAELREGE